jgi:hypothetical protein
MARVKTDENVKPHKPPGRVGGTIFPRVTLDEALKFAETLARKTQNGPQPIETALVSVFNNKGPTGGIRASALKQFGLLDGSAKDGGYVATPLARGIDAAPPAERPTMWRSAFLNSKIFAQIYEALQGDTVTKARVRQIAMTNGVHGTNADLCVDLFVAGAIKTELATAAPDDKYNLVPSTGIITVATVSDTEEPEPGEQADQALPLPPAPSGTAPAPKPKPPASSNDSGGAKTGAQLQLHVDSSSDPDKLRKQLELLREFGMI